MPTLPRLDIKTGFNHSPHVVILGAGASRACCPNGDRNGRRVPVMGDFVTCLDLADIIRSAGQDPAGNFEAVYTAIHRACHKEVLSELDARTRAYFGALTLPNEPTVYDLLVLSLFGPRT
ncbi:MAG TPA: hypothetical protein VGQ19_18050 [Burkholderiales bacterium]|jgi:hypothetical protein|nr:hypothetical protein [Burkholderiales bacterium]